MSLSQFQRSASEPIHQMDKNNANEGRGYKPKNGIQNLSENIMARIRRNVKEKAKTSKSDNVYIIPKLKVHTEIPEAGYESLQHLEGGIASFKSDGTKNDNSVNSGILARRMDDKRPSYLELLPEDCDGHTNGSIGNRADNVYAIPNVYEEIPDTDYESLKQPKGPIERTEVEKIQMVKSKSKCGRPPRCCCILGVVLTITIAIAIAISVTGNNVDDYQFFSLTPFT